MGKKKFIDKKKAATFRLVFKDSSEQVYGDNDGDGNGPDRTFMRVGGGHGHVAGFDDDESEGSIFEDAEEEEGGEGRGKDRSLRVRSKSSSSATTVSRQEIIELGFPDDGYNYLQHLREIGPSGRTGSFVPNNNLRLDVLRPDVKAYDASKIHVLPSAEEARSDALLVSGKAFQLRGPSVKGVDPDVAALLEDDDDHSLVSGDELEDDFVVIANDGVEKPPAPQLTIDRNKLEEGSLESGTEYSDTSEELELGNENERPGRLLDEQFELLAMREYDDDDIGELDYDDPQTRGHAPISRFDNVISDFLINTSVSHDKYQTPAEIEGTLKDKPSGGGLKQEEKVDSDNEKADCILSEYESSEEKELVIAEDTDEDNHAWDCETIVTTFSNLDNHPGKIYASDKGSTRTVASRVEVNKSVIRLYGKQQIPTDYLPRQKPDKGKSCDDNKKSLEAQEVKPCGSRQRMGETKEEKKARKAATKEGKRMARAAKKEMKLLYKDESQRAQHTAAMTGPGTVHLS